MIISLPNEDGVIYSQVFPGFIDKAALLAGNLEKVLEVLQQGLASAEDQSFVEIFVSKYLS
ncbi:hypothetical protein LC593_02560 [Nostoc sp. CHAB 5844]|nr:hypothetical protein [Nostoc sp. CHAB 5844]